MNDEQEIQKSLKIVSVIPKSMSNVFVPEDRSISHSSNHHKNENINKNRNTSPSPHRQRDDRRLSSDQSPSRYPNSQMSSNNPRRSVSPYEQSQHQHQQQYEQKKKAKTPPPHPAPPARKKREEVYDVSTLPPTGVEIRPRQRLNKNKTDDSFGDNEYDFQMASVSLQELKKASQNKGLGHHTVDPDNGKNTSLRDGGDGVTNEYEEDEDWQEEGSGRADNADKVKSAETADGGPIGISPGDTADDLSRPRGKQRAALTGEKTMMVMMLVVIWKYHVKGVSLSSIHIQIKIHSLSS